MCFCVLVVLIKVKTRICVVIIIHYNSTCTPRIPIQIIRITKESDKYKKATVNNKCLTKKQSAIYETNYQTLSNISLIQNANLIRLYVLN